MLNRDHPKEWLSSECKINLIPFYFFFPMSPDFPMNSNANKIRSIETLNDLITVLNQVRDKVGGNVKVMGAHDCNSIEDVLIFGMQSMMNKTNSEDTRIVIVL